MHRNALLIILAASLLAGTSSCGRYPSPHEGPEARLGVLDMSHWNLERDGIINLPGDWEFYWNELLEPADFTGPGRTPTGFFKIPDTWGNYRVQGKKLSCRGYATYRLIVRTGRNRGLLALKLQEINHAHRLWINGRLVSVHGRVARTNEEMVYANYPKLVFFQSDSDTVEFILQVSNYNDIVCGILRNITLGKAEQMGNQRDLQVAFNLFLFGSLLIMGFYHIGLYALRRKEPSALYFGIFCVLISLRSILTEERIIFSLLPGMGWEFAIRVEFLTLLGAPLFAWFLTALYKEEFNERIMLAFNYAGAIFAFMVIFLPARIFILSLVGFQIMIAVMGVYAGIGLVRAVARKREGALVMAAGFAILFATLINDILHSRMLIQSSYLVPFGLFIFIFSQSFLLSMRSSRSFAKVESLSSKLELYADHLEEMVVNRTAELQEERNKLKMRNELIEKEISMARKIQQQLIPATDPADYIHSLYIPMDSVGGDFYDFIRFRDSRRLGIFLSDVSGHGVPAAFVTSMIKSIILQSERFLDDPAAFLGNLNHLLADKTGGNFVTAFYGVFDPANGRIDYANAGHYPPYVMAGGTIAPLHQHRGIPLAILDNNELTNYGKEYRNCRSELAKGSRLILYTDGLIEAMMGEISSEGYDEELIEKSFLDLEHLPNRLFVQRLMETIIKRRGNDKFDDDVCIICVDVP